MTSTDPAAITIARATVEDAAAFTALASSTFVDTFAADNDPADMVTYCAESFGEAVQRGELLDPRHTVLFARRGGDLLGYAMLRDGEAPPGVAGAATIEIARLYATRAAIGSGVGGALMQACLDAARARGRDTIWLGVWEHNARAIAFYRRWGFVDVGMHHFQLGRDRQVDRIMTRDVAAPR